MSKIGRKPIPIQEGVTVILEKGIVTVSGPKGTLSYALPSEITIAKEEDTISVALKKTSENNAIFGLVRATIANMIQGVTSGFEKKLELSGVGYRATLTGKDLMLSVGFSHPVKISAPDNIQFSVSENTITVSGVNSMLIGDIAAKIRKIRPPEPYKGKGIKYVGERIRRKVGKAAKAVGTK